MKESTLTEKWKLIYSLKLSLILLQSVNQSKLSLSKIFATHGIYYIIFKEDKYAHHKSLAFEVGTKNSVR